MKTSEFFHFITELCLGLRSSNDGWKEGTKQELRWCVQRRAEPRNDRECVRESQRSCDDSTEVKVTVEEDEGREEEETMGRGRGMGRRRGRNEKENKTMEKKRKRKKGENTKEMEEEKRSRTKKKKVGEK